MKIYNKKYDIRKILLKKINYTSKIMTYANPYSALDKYKTNISRNINSTYIKDKNKKINCDDYTFYNDDYTFYYDDNEIYNEDDNGYIILPDIDPPNCKSPNCSYLLNIFGERFKDSEKTKYKKDILYHNYTLKTNGDEEDVNTLIKLILEEINEIQDLIEEQIKIKNESLNENDDAKICYENLFDPDYSKADNKDDKKLIKGFQDKLKTYALRTVKINNILGENNFEIII